MKLVKKASVLLVKKLTKWAVKNLVAAGPLLLAAGASGQCEFVKVLSTPGAPMAYFGWAADMSADGNTALVGAIWDEAAGAFSGAAYVFVREGSTWKQQAMLLGADAASGDQFGDSVALSADGNIAVVGATTDDNEAGEHAGSAYVFSRRGSVWSQEAKLRASDAAEEDHFGQSVGISAKGDLVVVGAVWDDDACEDDRHCDSGSAYVFVRRGKIWVEQAKLIPSDGASNDFFGSSSAVSGDSNTIVIGAMGSGSSGAAYLFVKNGATWTATQKLTPSDGGIGDRFGKACDLSADGSSVLVGAAEADMPGACRAGAAYIFARQGLVWIEQAKLTASKPVGAASLGYALTLSPDGETALIGARTDDGEIPNSGSAYLFVRRGSIWSEQVRITASDPEQFDAFGNAVAMSADASTAIIGAPRGDDQGLDSGFAYVFNLTPVLGDVNCDGSVGVADLLILLGSWGACGDCKDCPADLDGDCVVGVPDLLILLGNWG
ncbi:MAG: PKD domain-containing protein [Planctomycetes bacterium]|nr:PKD domain-containing protein [Planctomycetota bacterium]